MKLYSIWQPLDDEDQRTAMVFGFLRHAPVEHGLSPWLSKVLGRPVIAEPLEPSDFWPGYTSHMPECMRTYPELVFRAVDDAGPLHVVVEAKPRPGMHDVEQLVREAVDTAHGEPTSRIAVIAVGAGAYAAFFFGSGEDPQLQVGAFKTTWENLLVEYDCSHGVDELTDEHLAGYAGPDLTIMASAANSEWLYDERPWHSGQQDGDIAWTIERLGAAASIFDGSTALS
jgi:hypothetical protein